MESMSQIEHAARLAVPEMPAENRHDGVPAHVADAFYAGVNKHFPSYRADRILTALCTRSIAAVLCAALSSCAAVSPSVVSPSLPPDVFGVYEDNDVGALNQSSAAFAVPSRTRDNPIDAARAVIAVEYLADELRANPRWIGMSGTSRFGMLQARTDTRRVLGIVPDAPPQLVINALLRFTVALSAGDQAAAMRILGAPVFTLPPSQTARILSNLPYIQSANLATLRASNEAAFRND
jgi:hypothetical protein